jgi:transcriptional regulator with XRE-family HTH domain
MKIEEKNKARELRKNDKTLTEILKEVKVSKGSLSYWLRDIRLSEEQLSRIRYKNDGIKGSFIEFNKLIKERAENSKKLFLT